MKTILITGCSSGFGHETAKYFLEREWKVIATMRTPRSDLFAPHANLRILPLDVTDAESIRRCVAEAGPIDALVNNAGIGLLNALEGVSMDTVRKIFETNTFGTIAMTQAVLPQFRERKEGVIVNVTSTVTVKSLALLSVYTASKAAVNALTECLALELQPFNIRVRIVLPGRSPESKFAENAGVQNLQYPPAYDSLVKQVFAGFQNSTEPTTHLSDVAEGIWNAVNDSKSPMRIPAGEDAHLWVKQARSAYAE